MLYFVYTSDGSYLAQSGSLVQRVSACLGRVLTGKTIQSGSWNTA